MAMRLKDQSLFLVLAGVSSAAMVLPALHAVALGEVSTALYFASTGALGLVLAAVVALARSNRTRPRHKQDLGALLSLLAVFAVLPLLLAVPFYETLRTTTFLNAYVEMVSSLTTTGATLYEADRLPPTLHLWRAQVGWMGGFLIWTAAAAILAPLSLGGFEVTSAGAERDTSTRLDRFARADVMRRMMTVALRLGPVYAGLTGALWLFLILSGETPLTGIVHAMSTMATSGISNLGGLEHSAAGRGGEILVFLFLLFALSRITFTSDTSVTSQQFWRDPEFRIGIGLVIIVPTLLFLRHWLAAFEVDAGEDVGLGISALWGSVFTIMSFLTTTGFQSADWSAAQAWSGLGTPGMILMGLAMVGGGVATTAGGVKLLRVFALYLAGLREMERLVHPHSISGAGGTHRRIRRHGAFQAWIYFMLFAITLAAATAVLAAFGSSFENSIAIAIAGLTTTGPILTVAVEQPISVANLDQGTKLVFSGIMILGRLELIAIIALMNGNLLRD